MSIAEKIIRAKTDYDEVYAAGAKSFILALWYTFQNGGAAKSYVHAFSYDKFDDETYNPQHPIVVANASTAADSMFYNNTKITDTKVPIVLIGSSGVRAQNTFACYGTDKKSALVTIRELVVGVENTFSSTFLNCSVLRDLTITGIIGNSINLQWSPLSRASLLSVLTALSADVTGKTATFKKSAVNAAFTTEEWDALVATKPNWTIALA